MAEKRQSSLLDRLKDSPFSKAGVSEVRDNETDNREHDMEEADYFISNDSRSETDEEVITEIITTQEYYGWIKECRQ